MKFVIQHNLMTEDQLRQVYEAVSKYPHVFVGVIPFSREITCDEELIGRDYIPYGSTLLSTLLLDRGWKGMYLDLKKMNYRTFLVNHPCMLNDGVMSAAKAIKYLGTLDPNKEIFTRPSEDLKQYSGIVMKAGEIIPWFQSMIEAVGGGTYYMPPETEVVICEPKNISAEWRWFIVGGKIVSGSMYRAHGQLRKLQETDPAVIAEAQALADIWLPHQCVVMDTALVGDEVKVIEFNTINSSGFYAHDVSKIFDALWNYHKMGGLNES